MENKDLAASIDDNLSHSSGRDDPLGRHQSSNGDSRTEAVLPPSNDSKGPVSELPMHVAQESSSVSSHANHPTDTTQDYEVTEVAGNGVQNISPWSNGYESQEFRFRRSERSLNQNSGQSNGIESSNESPNRQPVQHPQHLTANSTDFGGLQQALLSEVKGDDFPQIVPSLWESFVDSAQKYPTNLAIASVHQKGEFYGIQNLLLENEVYKADPYLRWSYADFASAVVRTIRALQSEGISQGCSIFTFCSNSAEFTLIIWAGIALGCSVIPIHTRNLLNKEEALHIIKNSKAATTSDRAIIFAQNADLANQILNLGLISTDLVVVMEEDTTIAKWSSFASFFSKGISDEAVDLTKYLESSLKWALIIFTSGTTALPKGIVLNSFRIDRIIAIRRHAVPIAPGDSCFLALPNNNAFFHLFELLFPGCGAAVILAGPSFQPQNSPQVMELERCTHFPMSPTMVHAIMEVVKTRGIKFDSLKNITTGGAKLSIEFVKGCFEIIGSKGAEIIYGSTEGCVTVSTGVITDAESIVRDGDAAVGVPRLGCSIKICHPGDRKPVPRNTEGELHYASVTRSDGYAGGEVPQPFYTDEDGKKWFATGDAAMINDEGLVFIVGRIKDMIIRGGLNIAPAAIEFVLGKDPETEPFQVQIVGKLDPIAGEVPVGVSIKPLTPEDINKIQSTILRDMGPVYEAETILSLEQLGLKDFPRTMLGKVQKGKLRETVQQYLEDQDSPKKTVDYQNDELTKKVQKVWIRTIGHAVNTETKISSFADSITIMRVRDRFKRDLGANISLAEILDTQTVSDQVRLIREQSEQKVPIKVQPKIASKGPTVRDLIHLATSPQWFPSTQAWISEHLGKVGLEWDDIHEITPASDFTSTTIQADIQNTGWSYKFAFLAREGIDKWGLRRGVETMLANNLMLPSFFFSSKAAFGSDISLHVMLKPTPKLFDLAIHDHGKIATKQEFADEVYKPYEYQMSLISGLLINFLLFDVEDCKRSGCIMVSNHAMMDATYMQLLFDDFDKGLGGSTNLEPHVSYKTWADSYYSLRTSLEAQVAVAWHVRRLDDLSAHKASVFPPAFDAHNPTVRTHVQGIDDNGYHTDFPIPGITNLRGKHSQLSAPTIVKAAWSLLNIYRNNTNTALFSNLQADRRRFPFVPKALELLSPAHTFEATNVAGPCLQDVINVIPLYPEESVLDFMHRVALDQEEVNEYAAAPLKTILRDVGPVNAEIMIDIFRSQIFNWTPGLGALQTHNPNENYEPLGHFIRPKLRLVINVDVGGVDDETCYAQIKSPLYDMDGLKSLSDDFQDFVTWLCEEGNWGRRMGDFKLALRSEEARKAVNGHGTRKGHIM